tara:strand:- start:692 stop:1573 length:882 start_codon:yes stop_codon:yes gene_type:complete
MKLSHSFNPEIPEIYQIETTNRCNLKCPGCFREYMNREEGDLNIDLLEKMIKRGDFDNTAFTEFQFVGEPLLYSYLDKAIDMLKSEDILVGMSTNGLLIHKHIDTLKKLDFLTVSVDSLKEIEYQKIRTGKLSILLNNLNLLFEEVKDTKIDLQVVDYGFNKKQFGVLKDFVDVKGWDAVVRRVDDCEIVLRKPELSRYIKKEMCLNPFLSVSVLWNGDVVSCCFCSDNEGIYENNVYGNLYKNTLKEIWKGKKVRQMRERQQAGVFTELCKRCYMKSPTLLHQQIIDNWRRK